MARQLKQLPKNKRNEWANWCRRARGRTATAASFYRGAWPLNPKGFALWLNSHLQAKYPGKWPVLTEWGYIAWEQARVIPPADLQADVRAVVESEPSPKEAAGGPAA